jgi:hypothetical protein
MSVDGKGHGQVTQRSLIVDKTQHTRIDCNYRAVASRQVPTVRMTSADSCSPPRSLPWSIISADSPRQDVLSGEITDHGQPVSLHGTCFLTIVRSGRQMAERCNKTNRGGGDGTGLDDEESVMSSIWPFRVSQRERRKQ